VSILEKIPELACPVCKGDLKENERLICLSCGRTYEIRAGIPIMLGDDLKELAGEVVIQDRLAGEYEESRYQIPYAGRYHEWWTGRMLAGVDLNGRILDNGCGIGVLFDRDFSDQIVGVDISSEMLMRAAKKSDQLILGNSQELPLKCDSFDLVFSRSLLHHLPRPELAVEEMARVMRPGGEMVLADTHSSLISALPRILARQGRHFSKEHRNLTRRAISSWLEPHFEIKEISYFGYLAYPLLGFPDLLDLFKYLPAKGLLEPVLNKIDGFLSRFPIVRTQSWGIIVKAVKLGPGPDNGTVLPGE
jgi:ubiquinone/menaquinone biosynthesis C-methylase UbiE/uncharacterized protein YbaR (Trm112 family)